MRPRARGEGLGQKGRAESARQGQPKNDTYETLCVTLNQIIYVDYEPVHHA